MKTMWWIGSIGLVLLTGCDSRKTVESPESPTAAVVAASPAVTSSPVAAAPPARSPSATVAVPPAPPVLAVPDLIPPTSATSRVPQIAAGRSNPFAAVTTTPHVTTVPAAARPQVAQPQASPPTVRPAATARPPAAVAPAPQAISNLPIVQPAAVVVPPPAAPIAPPAGSIARTIAVSGVVQTSGRTSAIVQVPQEGSRYVSEGDRLAGGRVLVKRIQAGSDDDRVVIFEQDGVEVSRPVGSSSVL